jgi:hypothetical protein
MNSGQFIKDILDQANFQHERYIPVFEVQGNPRNKAMSVSLPLPQHSYQHFSVE